MARELKVFCTPIGFHDAYVAAPSQKAALEAWGSDANLFARGMASVVIDPKLTKEPLAKPGQVIKRTRGTTEQHIAALPKSKSRSAPRAPEPPAKNGKAKPAKPKPSRQNLDTAEQALERVQNEYGEAAEAIRNREEALRRQRYELNAKRDIEVAELQRDLDDVRMEYDRAMEAWRD